MTQSSTAYNTSFNENYSLLLFMHNVRDSGRTNDDDFLQTQQIGYSESCMNIFFFLSLCVVGTSKSIIITALHYA